jgi:hypothetical protein
VNPGVSHRRNARGLKPFSLLFLALTAISLLLVHGASYQPGVSYVLLYLTVSGGVTAAVALLLLPTAQFSAGFSSGAYALYAAVISMMVFFTGGVSSELYVLYFALLLASSLHGSWRLVLAALFSVLFCYALTLMPGLLSEAATNGAATSLYRLGSLGLTGLFLLFATRGAAGAAEDYATDDGSVLLERVEAELAARRGVQVAVILVDPGREVEDMELLLERVRARVGAPVLLGDEALFGVVLSEVDDSMVESAARRALATASSLGAEEMRAGAAIYPRDARNAEDLLLAAGQALEAAFEIESPSAIVLASRIAPGPANRYRAAR